MYRFLLTPRWWAINVFVLLAIPFCLVMGVWQLGRFEDRVDGHREHQVQAEALQDAQEVPLAELLPPTTETVGQLATITGQYDVREELLVPGRSMDGDRGFYVLTPLLTADAAAVPVVRGWLPGEPDPASVPAPVAGETEVIGVLQAAESPRAVGAPTGLPQGQVGVISAASLINVLPYEVEDAWLTVREAAEPLVAVPPVAASGTGLDAKAFQNLGYTAEWFAFAAFVVFMWYRFLRREIENEQDAALGLGTTVPPASQSPERTSAEDGAADPVAGGAGGPGQPDGGTGSQGTGVPGDAVTETAATTGAGALEGTPLDSPGREDQPGQESVPDGSVATGQR